jgi:hypothetical protein
VRRSYEGWCECVMAGLHPASMLLGGDSIRFGGRPLARIMSCLSNCMSCVSLLFFFVLSCTSLLCNLWFATLLMTSSGWHLARRSSRQKK